MADASVVANLLLSIKSDGIEAIAQTTKALMETDAAVKRLTIDVTEDGVRMQGLTRDLDAATASTSRHGVGVLNLVKSYAELYAGFEAGRAAFEVLTGKMASDWEHLTQTIQGNTGITNAELADMRQEIIQLGAQGPIALGDIAEGFRQALNEGYRGADAFHVVETAWKAAIATGGNLKDMTSTLTLVMKDWNIPTRDAATAMGILMKAASDADTTLPELAQNFQKVSITASSIHMPLADAAAMYSELTRATHDAALAQTLWEGMTTHILNPTKQVRDLMAELAHTTGVDLASAYKEFAQGQITATALMEKAREATKGNAAETFQLFGGIRGGLGALKILGNGWQDYLKIQEDTRNSTNQLQVQFDNMMSTAAAKASTFENRMGIAALTLSKNFLPAMTAVLGELVNLSGWVDANLPTVEKNFDVLGTHLHSLYVDHKSEYDQFFADQKKGWQELGVILPEVVDRITGESGKAATSTSRMGDAAVGMEAVTRVAIRAWDELWVDGINAFKLFATLFGDGVGDVATFLGDLATQFEKEGAIYHDIITGEWGRLPGDVASLVGSMTKIFTDFFGYVEHGFHDVVSGVESIISGGVNAATGGGDSSKSQDDHAAAMKRDTQANKEYADQRAAVEQQERKTTSSTEADTGAHTRHKKSLDDEAGSYSQLQAIIKKYSDAENQDLAVIANAIEHHRTVTQQMIDDARSARDSQDSWNSALDRAKSLIDDNTAAISRMGAALAGINTGVLSQASSITITAEQSPVPGASAATAGLEKALANLPANLRSALDPEISKFGTEFSKTKTDYISSLEKEDGSLASGLKGLHDKFINDSKGADDKKLATLRTQYLDEVDKLKSGYLQHIAGLKDAFLKHVQDIEKAMSLAGSKPAQFDSLQSAIQTGLDAATKTVAIDLVTHSAALQKDTETLAYWTGQENSLKGKEAEASLRGAKATNDFSAVLDSTRQKLQTTFDQASAKLVLDERNGNTGAITGDRQRLDEAKANLDSFNTSVDNATGKVNQTKDAFASLESQLKDRATKALDTYLEALVKGGNSSRDMNDLWQKVIQTQKDDLSIAALRQRAEHDLALVTGDVTARMKDLADTLQASVDTDKAQAVSDLETYGKILPSHLAALKADSEALGKHAADVSKVDKLSSGFETPQTPSGRLGQEKSSADTAYQTALDQATLDLEHLGYVTQADRDALTEATRRKNELSQAESDATKITKAASATLTTFADVLKKITDRINTDRDTLALLVHNGNEHLNTPLPRTEQQSLLANAAARPTETSPLITKTVTDLVKAYNDNKKALADQTEADILAARKTHDWTQVIADSANRVKTDADTALANLTHVLDSDVSHSIQSLSQLGQVAPVVAAQLQRSAAEEEQQTIRDTQASRLHELAMIRAAQAAGDLAGAFDKQKSLDSSDLSQSFSALEEHFRTGAGDLATLEAAYQRNQAAVNLDTAAQTQAYEATGQYADALKALTDGPTKDFENALAKVNIDLLTHSGNLGADVTAAQQARGAKDAETQAAWDATFATSSLADQSKMLSQRFSDLVSHQNTIDSAQSSVDSANIQIIAAQSTLAVDGINAQVKATEDLAGIIGKEDAVRSASASGQIAAITDQTKYISDSTAVLKATSPEALRVAQQQLLIDQVTAQEHRAEAAWQVRLASDALRTEQDKARGDQAAAAAQIRVAGDALQVATDQRQLAVDQQQLTLDELDVLADINSNLGGVNDYGEQIKADLAALSSDKQSISSDQTSLGNDTASANAIAAYNAQQAAMDSLLTAYDQSGSSSTSQDYQLQLAYLEQQKALYQVAVDQLSTQQQMASNLGAYSGQLQQMLFDFMGLLNLPAVRKNVVGMGTAQQMNGRGYDVQTITNVTPS